MLNILLVIIISVILINVLFSLKEKFQNNEYQPLIDYNSNLDNNLLAYEFTYVKGDKGEKGDPGEDATGFKYAKYFESLIS